MKAFLAPVALLLLMAARPALGLEGPVQGPSQALARASIDPNLFRDGEVRRRNESFGHWSLDCDEVPRLAQRFCSLRSVARDTRHRPVARVTISTDELGRPAALLDFPPATDLTVPVTVTAATPLILQGPSKAVLEEVRTAALSRADRRRGAPPALLKPDVLTAKLPVAVCDPSSCQAVWPLKPSDIAALRAGSGLRMTFRVVLSSPGDIRSGAALATHTVEALVPSDGFDAAIRSSVR